MAVIKDTNDVPKIASLPDTFSYIATMHTIKSSATDLRGIARYEWSTDGVTFRGTRASDTAFRMPDTTTPNYMVCVRAVDDDGNASKVDTIRIIAYGQIVDSRDNQTYKYIKIGTQTWMAENLKFAIDSSWWKSNSPDSGTKYGRIYSWASAMGFNDSCNNRTSSCQSLVEPLHQGVCLSGYHIPSPDEWSELVRFVELDLRVGSGFAGFALKATSSWKLDWDGKNGADLFGFCALSGGDKLMTWQSSHEYQAIPGQFYNFGFALPYGSNYAQVGGYLGGSRSSRNSIRCLKN